MTRPAALFLHGVEQKTSNTPDGHHIHGLNKDDIKAEPHYAGAIRCVRDTKKDFSADNKVPGDIDFDSTEPNLTGRERTATVKIQFSGEQTSRIVKVTQEQNNQ